MGDGSQANVSVVSVNSYVCYVVDTHQKNKIIHGCSHLPPLLNFTTSNHNNGMKRICMNVKLNRMDEIEWKNNLKLISYY